MFDQTFTGPKDGPKIETVEKDGIVVKLQREDPFGLIYLSVDGVTLPEEYQGRYTDTDYAFKAANKYLLERAEALEQLTKVKQKIKAEV